MKQIEWDDQKQRLETLIDDRLPKSEELRAIRSLTAMDSLYVAAEQRYINKIGGDWEVTVLEFFKKSSKYFENQSADSAYLTLLAFVADISKATDVSEDLLSLSDSSIQEILSKTSKNLTTTILRSYFQVLKKVEVSEIVILNNDLSDLEQLAHSVLDLEIRQNIKNLSLKFLTLAFNEAHSLQTGVNRLRSTMFVLLAGVYGERKVASILLERRSNKIRFTEAVLIFLLENEPSEDIPLLWRLQFVTFESKQDPMFWMQKL